MPINITYSGTIKKLADAIKRANGILKDEDYFLLIASKTRPFSESNPTNLSPNIIADLFRKTNLPLALWEYETKPSVGGKFSSRYPKRIWANRNAIPRRTTCSLAAMLVHECVHALSYHNKKYNFSHDNDPPSRNQGTAPYWIQGKVREKYCGAQFIDGEKYIVVESKD